MSYFIFFVVFFVMFSIAVLPCAAQNNVPPEVREMARRVMMPLVYQTAGTDKVTVVQNLKYTETADKNILMDIYQPPGLKKGEKRPAVIFLHGGAKPVWTAKDWRIFTDWGRLAAANDLIGVTFTHRLEYLSKSLENAAQDVNAAIKYVRANADKYNIDKDRICLVAYSAGGSLLSLAMRGDTPFIKCIVGFYAFMDIAQTDYQKTETPEIIKSFSPLAYLEKDASKIPPIFLARAGRDQVVGINDSIDRFVQTAIAKNISLTFANHPNGVHGFDNQTDDERSREIIRQSIEFMKNPLQAK